MYTIVKSIVGRLAIIICANLLILGALDKIIAPIPFLELKPQLIIPSIVGLEVLLALALIFRPNNYSITITILLLGMFSIYEGFKIYSGATTCGCFDHVGLSRTPAIALASNLLLMLGLASLLRTKIPLTNLCFIWLLPAFMVVAYSQSNSLTHAASISTNSGYSSVFPGKRVILKVTPDCESCLRFTAKIITRYQKIEIAAVTLNDNQEAIKTFEKQFGIKLTLLSLEDFVRIGGAFKIPDAYEIYPEKLKQISEAEASPTNQNK